MIPRNARRGTSRRDGSCGALGQAAPNFVGRPACLSFYLSLFFFCCCFPGTREAVALRAVSSASSARTRIVSRGRIDRGFFCGGPHPPGSPQLSVSLVSSAVSRRPRQTRRRALFDPARAAFQRERPHLSSAIGDDGEGQQDDETRRASSGADSRSAETTTTPQMHPVLPPPPCRLALLRISYDGRAFTGWSAANDPNTRNRTNSLANPAAGAAVTASVSVRSVQGEIVTRLRQLYGNRDDQGVALVLDSCSRTDRGVHSSTDGMVALVYAYRREIVDESGQGADPANAAVPFQGSELLPTPMPPARMIYALNRMLPGDVRITGIAAVERSDSSTAADHNATASLRDGTHHETKLLSSSPPRATTNNTTAGRIIGPPVKLRQVITNVRKTYRYRFSTGLHQDPLSRRVAWHVQTAPVVVDRELDNVDGAAEVAAACDFRSAPPPLDLERMRIACRILEGTHNSRAFQAGPRGSETRNPRTVCKIESIIVTVTADSSSSDWNSRNGGVTYMLEVTGDRFLYKMVRLMAGCVVAVGQGRMEPELIQRAFIEGAKGDDWPEFQCAPAHGLTLVDVQFNIQPGWDVRWL